MVWVFLIPNESLILRKSFSVFVTCKVSSFRPVPWEWYDTPLPPEADVVSPHSEGISTAAGSCTNSTIREMHQNTACSEEEREANTALLLFRPLTLSFELTLYTRRTIVIPTVYLQPPSHKDNDYTSTRFVTVSLSAFCNTTFSLTVCLLTVSLGILARVGQEHRSTVQEQLLSETRITLKSIKQGCYTEQKMLWRNLLLKGASQCT